MTTEQRLIELGYVEMDTDKWYFRIYQDTQWLIGVVGDFYRLSEWRGDVWHKLAIFMDGDLLIAVLESIGACDR